jgi:hypothetical protein
MSLSSASVVGSFVKILLGKHYVLATFSPEVEAAFVLKIEAAEGAVIFVTAADFAGELAA